MQGQIAPSNPAMQSGEHDWKSAERFYYESQQKTTLSKYWRRISGLGFEIGHSCRIWEGPEERKMKSEAFKQMKVTASRADYLVKEYILDRDRGEFPSEAHEREARVAAFSAYAESMNEAKGSLHYIFPV